MILHQPEGMTPRSARAARICRADSASASPRPRPFGDPKLVVLDEPNANLDGEGEEALTRAVLGIRMRNGIAIVVAHRPSALAGVDLVLVLKQGRVAAFGPRDEILRPAGPATPPARRPKLVPSVVAN